MHHIKLALVQHAVSSTDIGKNTALAVRYMREAAAHGADLVLFPECFLTAYTPPDICRTLQPLAVIERDPAFRDWCERALTPDSDALRQVRETARKLRIGAVITGFAQGARTPRNTAWLIDREGEIRLQYAKVHTCDFDWERYLESGDAFHVCAFDGVRVGVMICYDREYPESARELMLQGAELILVPNDCGNMRPRLRELSVAAMQNMAGVAMANPPGEQAGCSCAYTPMVWDADNTLSVAEATFDGIVYADFDMDAIRAFRREEDLGKYRKPHAYRHLLKT